MNTHTPGPWKVTYNKKFNWYDISHCHICEWGETPTIIKVEDYQDEPYKTGNANLIAAAPELLEALKMLRNILHEHVSGVSSNYFEAWNATQKAISKAEGEQS